MATIAETAARVRRVLLVDNIPNRLQDMVAAVNRPPEREVVTAGSREEALRRLEEEGPWDLVVTDMRLVREEDGQDASGLDVVRVAHASDPPPKIIVVTSHPATDAMVGGTPMPAAAAAMILGAFAFVPRYEPYVSDIDLLRVQADLALMTA